MGLGALNNYDSKNSICPYADGECKDAQDKEIFMKFCDTHYKKCLRYQDTKENSIILKNGN